MSISKDTIGPKENTKPKEARNQNRDYRNKICGSSHLICLFHCSNYITRIDGCLDPWGLFNHVENQIDAVRLREKRRTEVSEYFGEFWGCHGVG